MRTLFIIALLVGCSWTPCWGVVESSLALNKAISSIQSDQLRDHTETLAADSFEGREAGQRGGRAAATYIMKELQAAKLQPAGQQGTYFQSFRQGFRNILAVIPGTDETLKDEYLLITAHYDHVGYGTRRNSNGPVGFIHNGADDNASGVASLLELAEALRAYGPGLPRTILFVWWDAEEKGLWGSKHWLEQPTVDIGNVKFVLNVDMVGRLRKDLQIYGTRTTAGMRSLWSRNNVNPELKLRFPWVILDNSDHFPFFQRGIPIAMVHTGLHDDYHRPSDDASRINVEGVRATTELLLRFVVSLAQRPSIGEFRADSRRESSLSQRQGEPTFQDDRPKLGVSWGARASVQDGLRLTRVWAGSLADQAGIRTGDRIVAVNGQPLESAEQLRRAVAATFGDLALGVQRRNGQTDTITVTFGGEPPRVGIAWRSDPAEPKCLVITRVVPGFPADVAGIERLDRVHEVNGEAIGADDQGFREKLVQSEGDLRLTLERQGQIKELVLTLPPLVTPDDDVQDE